MSILPTRFFVASALALAGCGSTPSSTGEPASTGATSTTGEAAMTASTSTGVASTSTTTSPTTGEHTSNSSDGFLTRGDSPSCPGEGAARCLPAGCTIWQQNCQEGEKCSPYSDGGVGEVKCVPLGEDPDHVGEPCTVEGSVASGFDSCDLESVCWNVDKESLTGVCVGFCTGSPEAPMCPDGSACAITHGGSLPLCLPTCDPLGQDCAGEELCVPGAEAFVCAPDASGDAGQVFDACEFKNGCDPGLVCTAVELASECDPIDYHCCLPFCDTTAPGACPGAMQACLPWFEMGMAPAGHEDVGVCGLEP